jgi:hypothetical protein
VGVEEGGLEPFTSGALVDEVGAESVVVLGALIAAEESVEEGPGDLVGENQGRGVYHQGIDTLPGVPSMRGVLGLLRGSVLDPEKRAASVVERGDDTDV